MQRKWFVFFSVLVAAAMLLAGCGGGAASPQSVANTALPPQPTVTPKPAGLEPGTFRFEVVGNNEDKVITGNLLQTQIAQGYTMGMVESGDFARYGVTLFLPMDVAPGTYDLLDVKNEKIYKAPMGSVFIGAWFYNSQVGGKVVITAVENGTISGSYEFIALREESTDIFITVTGEFNQIALPVK
ncbi:MAG TPA: hypothetical protein VFF78_07375 [Anaerolineaceae bacterium]|nr:hypothetical protein [Anaerolineaceae bacterium]